MIQTMQNEWDEVMIDTFTLKQALDQTRRELSQALYQHDAACRVIARLMRERDEARAMLSSMGGAAPATSSSSKAPPPAPAGESEGVDTMDVAESADEISVGLWKSASAQMTEKMSSLSAERRGRKSTPLAGVPGVLDCTKEVESISVMATKKSKLEGIVSLAAEPTTFDVTAVQGARGRTALTGHENGTIVCTALSGKAPFVKVDNAHTTAVTQVSYDGASAGAFKSKSTFYSAAADGSVKIWTVSGKSPTCSQSFEYHSQSVVYLQPHPVSQYLMSVSTDGTWAALDTSAGAVARQSSAGESVTCGACHPDGLLIASATSSGVVNVWDMRERAPNFTQLEGGNGLQRATGLSFSENGYHLGTGHASGVVALWDLRKMKMLKRHDGKSPVGGVAFDYSAQRLAGAYSGHVTVLPVKEWSEAVVTVQSNTESTKALVWNGAGEEQQLLMTDGLDLQVLSR